MPEHQLCGCIEEKSFKSREMGWEVETGLYLASCGFLIAFLSIALDVNRV